MRPRAASRRGHAGMGGHRGARPEGGGGLRHAGAEFGRGVAQYGGPGVITGSMAGRHNTGHAIRRPLAEPVVELQPASNQGALHAPVLVLNASYEPINVCAARRAIVLVLKGVAMAEEENGHYLHGVRLTIRVPSVIRLLEYRRIPHQTRALSRKNILLRDRNTCQYCGTLLGSSELTLDHVIPRSRGGSSTWENLVACCHPCNRRKGNQLLSETDMKLLKEPRPFTLHTSRHIMRMIGRSDIKWRKYLFY